MLKSVIVSSLLIFSTAFADHHEEKGHKGHKGHHGPCYEDFKKHCKSAEGKEAKMKCLEENKGKFSKTCKDNMEKMKEAMSEVQEACKADIETHCKGMAPGDGLMKCMKENKKKLSKECRAEMKEKKKMRKKMKKGRE